MDDTLFNVKNLMIDSGLKYNKLQTDFKAEAVAANFIKFHNPLQKVLIKRIGINERPYLKDIKAINKVFLGLDDEVLMIESYRESIYDYLPEALFHPPTLRNDSRNVEHIIKNIKKQREIEAQARNFFQPFELEFFYTEISAQLKEYEFDVADQKNELVELISELWPILKDVDQQTAKTLIHILPFLHKVRGDMNWISEFLTTFNQLPVKITFRNNEIDQQDDEIGNTSLGKARLGLTLIPSGKHFDGERNWVINYGPIPYQKINQFVEGHSYRDLLQKLYDYLIPISVKVFENFITEKSNESFVLNKYTNRLGYATYI